MAHLNCVAFGVGWEKNGVYQCHNDMPCFVLVRIAPTAQKTVTPGSKILELQMRLNRSNLFQETTVPYHSASQPSQTSAAPARQEQF